MHVAKISSAGDSTPKGGRILVTEQYQPDITRRNQVHSCKMAFCLFAYFLLLVEMLELEPHLPKNVSNN